MAGFASRMLRVAALAGLALTATATDLAAQQKVGVSGAVNLDASGTPPGAQARRLVIGQDVVFNEHITTNSVGQTQLLFLDESSMTVGPNSDLTIDQFVYDPKSGTGKLAMSATRGLLRYVGGKLSKQDEAVTLRTSTATLAVRGGAFIAKITAGGNCPSAVGVLSACGSTEAIFIYGKGLTVTGTAGGAQTLYRPGYKSTTKAGEQPGSPEPEPAADLAQLLTQLDGRSGGNGGASVIPTDVTVVNSGLPGTISGNLGMSLQQSLQNQGPISPSPQLRVVNSAIDPNSLPIQTQEPPVTAAQPSGAGQVIDCISTGTCNPANTVQVGTTTSGQPVGGTGSVTPNPPQPPVAATYAGRLKNTNGNGTAQGFIQQTPNGDIGYSGGTLSFPPGSPQSGVFTGTFGTLGTITFPLVPGSAQFGPQGTSSSLGTFSGTSFLSADNTFFYANITPTTQPGQRLFVYGGLPVDPSFYQPTGAGLRPQAGSNTRLFAFTVQPDTALQANIPFVRSQAGGNLPNATVSPFYVVAPGATPFGSASSNAAARGLQASLAINGQGPNQQSVIAVTTGTVMAQQSNNQPIFTGQMRGSSRLSAGGTPVSLSSAASSTIDPNGNSFYGKSAISGFVVDQTGYTNGGGGTVGSPIIPTTATETPLTGTPSTYGFAQAAVPANVASGVGAARPTQAVTGNFGGLMYTAAQANPYIVTGGTVVTTDAATNRVQGNLVQGSSQSPASVPGTGIATLNMQYGGLSGTEGAQAYVDANTYAATETRLTAAPPVSTGYFASSGAAGVPTTLLQQAGATACQCQYLTWGYWGGDLQVTELSTNFSRVDRGHINTWVAGVPTPLNQLNSLVGASATATYNGHALGSVFNNGQSYLAAGGFNGTYNFGTQNGTIALTNFDGHNFAGSGHAPLNGANYNFTFASPGVKGTVSGTFYGPNAAETGGNFAVQSLPGLPTYLASGIFAGKQ